MKTRHPQSASSAINSGFQIAPMIDVVFVIMLFFMVMAGNLRIENRHNIQLPSPDGPTPLDGEIAIRIDSDGQVFLNEDPLDSPASKSLPELTDHLRQLHVTSQASKSNTLVTLYADESARYERIVDTLDSLTRAEIANVTFQAGEP